MSKRGSMVRRTGLLVLAGIPIWLGIAGEASAGTPPSTCQSEDGAADGGSQHVGGPPSGWLRQVQNNLAAREYEVTWQAAPAVEGADAAWHAPNRAHDFRTYFTPEGIRVLPRTEDEPSWRWGLALAGYGRAGSSPPLPRADLSPSGNRIDYRRGTLQEWYENGPRGLKQGFVLPAPPEEMAGWRDAGPLPPGTAGPGRGRGVEPRDLVHVDLALWGDLSPVVAADGQAIDFITPGGARAIRYAELRVTDARGALLPAWMEGFAGERVPRGIRLVVDVREAIYPVTIDPLATSPAWTAESDQASASFGLSVGTAGDVNGDGYADVIVGAHGFDNGETSEGRAFVYHGSALGLSLTSNWTAEGDQAGAFFGSSVGTAGDVNGDGYADVIVGARVFDNGETNEGRAFVYHGGAMGLSLKENWAAEGNQASAFFGISVGTAGDVNGDGYADVIVGAYVFDNGETDEGRAFVYHGSASGLSLTSSWTAEGGQASAFFGGSVGTAGDVNGDGYADVIVGASSFDNGFQTDEGRAFVYHGSASGLSLTSNWTAEGGQASAFFGVSVGTAGDVNGDGHADVIVGAERFDNGETDEGRAFVYHGGAMGLSLTSNWTAESDQASALFGVSVGTAGDVNGDGYADVIVAAYAFDNGETNEGRAFVYHGTASGLSSTSSWTAESDQQAALFGGSVATAGDVNGDGYSDVIVGAPSFDNGETDEGRAFVYRGSASGLSLTSSWTAEGEQTNERLAFSAGTAGDVNGDGYADLIVGAALFDNGETDEGRALVFHGSASGLSLTPSWTAEGDQASAFFGISVGTAGDVNGDGYADVIVGANQFDNGETDEGHAFVYHGSASGLSLTSSWMAEGDQASAGFGFSAGTAGDVNGDGYSDVMVGASSFDNGETDEGRAFVYHGSASGLSLTSSWTAESDQASAGFGFSAGTAGDVNGDGYADVIVGAVNFYNGQVYEGRAFVYHGTASGLSLASSWTAEGDLFTAQFGCSAGTAGDVNGDGYADVIVGACNLANGETQEGRAYVYNGSASGLLVTSSWTAEGDQAMAFFGRSVGTAGDVNGDGYADVIVGAPFFTNGTTNEGRAFVYHGSASGLSLTSNWTAEGDEQSAEFGRTVGTAGDVNGDGYADVIVGAPGFGPAEGRAFLYSGNAGPGLSVRPQQRRSDDTALISALGASDSASSFRLSALGRTPFGRGLVKLEWEIKPLGALFDGTATQMSAGWIDTGTAGASLAELAEGLSSPTVHHWRLRLRYHPATTPFQQHSRWFTVPRNGWQEGDLRTLAPADLEVTQTEGAEPTLFGGNLTYVVSVLNAGPQGVPGTTLRDTLPGGSAFVAASPSQGSCGPPAAGVVTCELGALADGGGASVTVTVTPASPGSYTNTAEGFLHGLDPDPANNISSETTTVIPPALGDRAWEDTDRDGVQDPGEPGVADVLVALYDGAGNLLDATLTDTLGNYSFPNLTFGATYGLRFVPPSGYFLTAKDQGADDALDSDADPLTQRTPAVVLVSGQDPIRWDAGLIGCLPPDEPLFMYLVTLTTDGNNFPILHSQDANQPNQVTGYNVYRSSDASLPLSNWPLVASDVIDMDEATPNKQWVDTSGDVSPTGIWYYNLTAYNSVCGAEGPF